MELVVGQKYKCEVVEIRQYGAIVKMEDGTRQLLHISNISDQFVKDVADFVSIGETYEVTAIPGKSRDVEITLRESRIAQVSPPKEDFETMLRNYLPTPSDRRYKHDSDGKPRRKSKNH